MSTLQEPVTALNSELDRLEKENGKRRELILISTMAK